MKGAPQRDTPEGSDVDLAAKTVGDAMHPGLVYCSPHLPLTDVARLMAEQRLHSVVVVDDPDRGSPVWGVISDLDLIAAASVRRLGDQVAAGSAVKPAVTIAPGEPLQRAVQLMVGQSVSHLIVVEPVSKRPIGVLSALDLFAALAG